MRRFQRLSDTVLATSPKRRTIICENEAEEKGANRVIVILIMYRRLPHIEIVVRHAVLFTFYFVIYLYVL